MCLLQMTEKSGSECESELIDGNDQPDDSRKVLLRELLLNNEPRERDQIPKAEAEQSASEIEYRRG